MCGLARSGRYGYHGMHRNVAGRMLWRGFLVAVDMEAVKRREPALAAASPGGAARSHRSRSRTQTCQPTTGPHRQAYAQGHHQSQPRLA